MNACHCGDKNCGDDPLPPTPTPEPTAEQLPECFVFVNPKDLLCICDRLRHAEKRGYEKGLAKGLKVESPEDYYIEGLEAGAKAMRERAAKYHDDCAARASAADKEWRAGGQNEPDPMADLEAAAHRHDAKAIRALPLIKETK